MKSGVSLGCEHGQELSLAERSDGRCDQLEDGRGGGRRPDAERGLRAQRGTTGFSAGWGWGDPRTPQRPPAPPKRRGRSRSQQHGRPVDAASCSRGTGFAAPTSALRGCLPEARPRHPARGGAAQRAGGCRSPWPRGSQTDPAQPPPADRIQRQGRVVGNREASLLPRGPRKTASQTVSEVPKTPLGLNEDSVRRGWGVRAGGQGRPG